MSRNCRASRGVALASLLALTPLASSARADSVPGPSRATIRGTSSGVTIVYRSAAPQSPAGAASFAAMPAPAADASGGWVIAEATELKTRGADDATVIAFLRLHRAEIPAITEGDTVKQLRKAGAGDPVIVALSSLTAVDIGETGEGGFVAYAPAVADMGAYGYENPYDMAGVYGYGGYGGFVSGFGRGARAAMRIGSRGFVAAKRFPGHPGRPMPSPHPMPVSGGHRAITR